MSKINFNKLDLFEDGDETLQTFSKIKSVKKGKADKTRDKKRDRNFKSYRQ